jgi:hypothetical protein
LHSGLNAQGRIVTLTESARSSWSGEVVMGGRLDGAGPLIAGVVLDRQLLAPRLRDAAREPGTSRTEAEGLGSCREL